MGFGGFGFNTAQGTVGGFAPAQGSSSFSPADLTGLVDWWDADLTYMDATPVGQWTGRVNSLVLAEATNKPDHIASGQNGQPVVRFNGTDDHLSTSAFGAALTQPNTIFLAAKYTSGSSMVDGIVTGSRNMIWVTGGLFQVYAGSTTGVGPASDTNFNIFTGKFNGSSSTISVNGTESATGVAGAHTMTGLTVGSNFSQGAFAACDIGTIIVVDGLSSAGEIAQVEQFLASKYGV